MTFVDTSNWPICDVCHKKHDVVFMGGWATSQDFDRFYHPWLYPDRARVPRMDLFPRWTAFRSRFRDYRERVRLAWSVLKGDEPW